MMRLNRLRAFWAISRNTSATEPETGTRFPRDLVFISALLAVAAFPLLVLRHNPLFFSPGIQVAIGLVSLAVFAVWWLPHRRTRTASATQDVSNKPGRLRTGLFVVALAAAGLIVFYLPMREHFWGGYDEMRALNPVLQHVWSDEEVTDQLGRPTWGMGPMLGQMLTPDRIEGQLWFASGLTVLNALLLFGIVRRLLPSEPAVAAAAAVLLVCHRGDSSRFFVMWTGIWYWTTLAFLLLGTWLLLVSARSERRGLLVTACVSLTVSLLGSEAGYPLAALGPALLYLDGTRGRRLLVWSYAWLGTISLVAVRYVLYMLTNTGNYQSNMATGLARNPHALYASLKNSGVTPFLSWFDGFRFSSAYWSWGMGGLAAALAFVAVVCVARSSATRWSTYALAGVAAGAAALAGVAPFLLIGNGDFRTQFYTAPGQAVLLAVAAGGACRVFGSRVGAVALAAIVGLSAANARVENLRFQANVDKHINFVKTVRTFEQLRAVSPTTAPGTLTVLLTDDDVLPLGGNKPLRILSQQLIGYGDVMTTPHDEVAEVKWTPEGVAIDRSRPPAEQVARYAYDRIVVFRMAPDGTLFLLRQLPASVLSRNPLASGYNPLPLLRPGPITPIRIVNYPSWVEPPRDVIDPKNGLGFSTGWSDQEVSEGCVFRLATPGAELLVNPLGETSRTLQLELEAHQTLSNESFVLEVRDGTGRTLTRTPLSGTRETVNLTIPTDPERVSLISLWVCPAGSRETRDTVLRVFAPTGSFALLSKSSRIKGR